jgi:ATP diphosphatase
MTNIQKLLDIMIALRDPQKGCPWDREQNFRTIAPYTIEEAYEVVDAIDRENLSDLKSELGDLLLQVVFHAQMAKELGAFDFADVVETIADKMIRRHPHVFGEQVIESAEAQRIEWEAHKRKERESGGKQSSGALDGVSLSLPGLMRACKLGKRASGAGFDWPDEEGVRAKILEELAEIEEAGNDGRPDHVAEEIGDLLFTVANLARHLGVDPEDSLRAANRKFTVRFREMEHLAKHQERTWDDLTPAEMEELWQCVKDAE